MLKPKVKSTSKIKSIYINESEIDRIEKIQKETNRSFSEVCAYCIKEHLDFLQQIENRWRKTHE